MNCRFWWLWLLLAAMPVGAAHPQYFLTGKNLPEVRRKIAEQPWAKELFGKLKSDVDRYRAYVAEDPAWLSSRLAMYWKPGERYTRCRIVNEVWAEGEGDAPVPTVRLPGMRTWNDFRNVPLEARKPYNETGDMLGLSRKNPAAPARPVPYRESGHLIRANNVEILTIAEHAALLYRLTGEESYAKMAADVFWPWLFGTYYMEPPTDPSGKSGGPGGYAPGGIMGYYDYEQIHDDLQTHAAVIYDLLYDYLARHPHPHLKTLGKSLPETAGIVLKRFLDIGFVRGGKSGNWNVNGWGVMFPSIIALEPDGFYPDRKGREYYLKHFTSVSTDYHNALPDILKQYDPVTGLWPESPGYALGTVGGMMHFALILQGLGIDVVRDNPILAKAVAANFIWMDERGNLPVFGDSRANPANFGVVEQLLSYYTAAGQTESAANAAAVLKRGIQDGRYHRANGGWTDLVTRVATLPEVGSAADYRAAWSPFHRHLLLRNPAPSGYGLMAALYGGRRGWHLSPNGLAWQFYADGWCVAPDAAAYESYWSKDVHYHQGAVGANTILPGYVSGPVTLHAVSPAIPHGAFAVTETIAPEISFADMSAAEKRRMIGLIRSSGTAGYYVDIFRSRQPDNDYLHHNIGKSVRTDLATVPVEGITPAFDPNYGYFKNIRRAASDAPLRLAWEISPELTVDLWMAGRPGTTLYLFDAPPTTLNPAMTPGGVSATPSPTPSVIVRRHEDGWRHPFVALFAADKIRRDIRELTVKNGEFAGLEVVTPSLNRRKEWILTSTDDRSHNIAGCRLTGSFGVVCADDSGVRYLYLGNGEEIGYGGYRLRRVGEWGEAILRVDSGVLTYAADVPLLITRPGEKSGKEYPAARDGKIKMLGNLQKEKEAAK